ncbi:Putative esterase [Alteromonadaceae bacterium Bs31]|nr:Putative esterase [Alteromonadaceae bacterium Bs31]
MAEFKPRLLISLAFILILLLFAAAAMLFYSLVACLQMNAEVSGQRLPQFTFYSEQTDSDYPIDIYLPASYNKNKQQRFPVIYILDGHWVFSRYARLVAAQRLPLILVGIGEGQKNRRLLDYGPRGALEYSFFLKDELIPKLEKNYRIEAGKRTLAGISLSGAFAAVMLIDQEITNLQFSSYLLFDAAFDTDAEYLYQIGWFEEYIKHAEGFDWPSHPKIFISSALRGGNDTETQTFIKLMLSNAYPKENIYFEQFDVKHGKVGEPSFAWVLALLY